MFNFQSFLFTLIDHQIYTSFNELPRSWDTMAEHDIFLKSSYLQAMEQASPDSISWYYVGVFKGEELVGVAIAQRAQLYLKDMFRNKVPSVFKQLLISSFSKILKGNILVFGNLTHTGQHGLHFLPNKISQADFLKTLFRVAQELKNIIKQKQNKKIRVVMFKDYFKEDPIHMEGHLFKSYKLHKVNVQPNMIMIIKLIWLKPEDYIANLNKKYKTRYKRAKKKFGEIQSRELYMETIDKCSNDLYELYKNVSDNAKFNTFILPQNHFFSLKKELKENFKIFGYYLNNELIGFYSLILNNKTLETYFLGYDAAHQYQNQLYLNMLYDMAGFAITNNFSSVVYARTAMEIKSSVGAKPKDMIVYIKHTNGLVNVLLRYIFQLMNPTQKWAERHPFKD